MSLWDNPEVKAAIARLSPEDKLKYKRIGQELYNTIDFCDPKTVEVDYAGKVKLMLRDGLDPKDLSPSERQMYINVYGLKSLEEYSNG